MVDLFNGYAENVDLVGNYHIASGLVKDSRSDLIRDFALLRAHFGVDWTTKTPSELFDLINELWVYLFIKGDYSMSLGDDGEWKLNKKSMF